MHFVCLGLKIWLSSMKSLWGWPIHINQLFWVISVATQTWKMTSTFWSLGPVYQPQGGAGGLLPTLGHWLSLSLVFSLTHSHTHTHAHVLTHTASFRSHIIFSLPPASPYLHILCRLTLTWCSARRPVVLAPPHHNFSRRWKSGGGCWWQTVDHERGGSVACYFHSASSFSFCALFFSSFIFMLRFPFLILSPILSLAVHTCPHTCSRAVVGIWNLQPFP